MSAEKEVKGAELFSDMNTWIMEFRHKLIAQNTVHADLKSSAEDPFYPIDSGEIKTCIINPI